MTLHFFCCSDTHGKLPELPQLPGIQLAGTLHAGDIYNGATLSRGEQADPDIEAAGWVDPDVAEVGAWLDRAGPVYVVRGNHDLADPHRFFTRSQDVSGRVVRVADSVVIAGIGWHGDRYYELPGESEIVPLCDSLRRQLRRVTNSGDGVILLCHYPPRGDDLFPVEVPQTGWWHDCTRELVKEIAPIAVVQGHIHELAGRVSSVRTESGETLFIAPGKRGMIISVDTEARQARVTAVA